VGENARGAAGAGEGEKERGATGAGENERGTGAGLGGENERGATGAGLGVKARGAGEGGGENDRGATCVGEGANARGAEGGRGPGELENVRGLGVEAGDIGRGTSAAGDVAVGGNTGRENVRGVAIVAERLKDDDCAAAGCVFAKVRPWIGRAVACAKDMARASCEARAAGMPSAGTCASAIEGPRAADAMRYEPPPATPAVAPMYGCVRGATMPTRSEGTMYPRTRGEKTYRDEQNT
jgi:hypothetical protein